MYKKEIVWSKIWNKENLFVNLFKRKALFLNFANITIEKSENFTKASFLTLKIGPIISESLLVLSYRLQATGIYLIQIARFSKFWDIFPATQ